MSWTQISSGSTALQQQNWFQGHITWYEGWLELRWGLDGSQDHGDYREQLTHRACGMAVDIGAFGALTMTSNHSHVYDQIWTHLSTIHSSSRKLNGHRRHKLLFAKVSHLKCVMLSLCTVGQNLKCPSVFPHKKCDHTGSWSHWLEYTPISLLWFVQLSCRRARATGSLWFSVIVLS